MRKMFISALAVAAAMLATAAPPALAMQDQRGAGGQSSRVNPGAARL